MNITDAAIEAASLALHCDACTDDEHDACDCSDWAREAKTAIDAALPALRRMILAEVDQALEDITTATLGATLMHVITAQRDAVRAAILGGAS